jgi:hypothetical protein
MHPNRSGIIWPPYYPNGLIFNNNDDDDKVKSAFRLDKGGKGIKEQLGYLV